MDKISRKVEYIGYIKKRIDIADRLARLQNNEDFQLFMSRIKERQKKFDYVIKNPKKIGYFRKQNINGEELNVKITVEEDLAELKDAQIRIHTLQQVIDMVDNFVRDGQLARIELEKINNPSSSDTTEVKNK